MVLQYGITSTRYIIIFLCCTVFCFIQSCVSTEVPSSPELSDIQIDTIDGIVESDKRNFQLPAQKMQTAIEIPSAIVFLETDVAGNSLESHNALGAMLEDLEAAGFTIVNLSSQAESLLLYDISEIYRLIQEQHDVERLIVGTARIIEVDEQDGFIITVSGSLNVYDIPEESSYLKLKATAQSQGTSSAWSVTTAFINLGQDLATSLIKELH